MRDVGPDEAYKRVQQVLASLSDVGFGLSDVWIVKDTESLIELLRTAVRTTPDALADIRFSRNTIGGVFIEDAHIYRST